MQEELINITFTGPVEGSRVFELAERCHADAALLGLVSVTLVSVRCQPVVPRGETPGQIAAW